MGFTWDKAVINNICGEVKLALKTQAKAPNPAHVLHMKEITPTSRSNQ